jgi:hypothetical protein
MFGEDKLTRVERVRLEALSQAFHMVSHTSPQRPTVQEVFEAAEKIEVWLKAANGN